MEANDEVWKKNLNASAQDKSNLITITDEKKEIYQRITEMRTRTTGRKIEEQARQQGIELSKCEVSYSINNQSPEIADGVNVSKDDLDVDAGAQDMRVMRHTR